VRGTLRKLLLVLLLVPSLAYARGNKPTEVIGLPTPFDLLIGRFPRHIPEYVATSAPPPPAAGSYEALAWRVRFGGGERDPAAYVALADWHASHGEDELAWWASKRALELGARDPGLTHRCAALEAKWRAAGRKDPPTDEQYRFVRDGAERWVQAFQLSEQQSYRDKETISDEAVQRRIGEKADMQVPPAILGAESFMRRWGVALMIAGAAAVFWTLYLVAILRKRRGRS
jgi:hypothetical protein